MVMDPLLALILICLEHDCEAFAELFKLYPPKKAEIRTIKNI